MIFDFKNMIKHVYVGDQVVCFTADGAIHILKDSQTNQALKIQAGDVYSTVEVDGKLIICVDT